MNNKTMIGDGQKFPYEKWIQQGWTDALLMIHGFMADTRPIIRLEGGKLLANATIAARALEEKRDVVFVGRLAQKVVDPVVGLGNKLVTAGWVRLELMKIFRFEQFDRRAHKWVFVDCPKDLATVIVRDASQFFPHVGGTSK